MPTSGEWFGYGEGVLVGVIVVGTVVIKANAKAKIILKAINGVKEGFAQLRQSEIAGSPNPDEHPK